MEKLIMAELHWKSKRFMELVEEEKATHIEKARRYGSDQDPLGNLMAASRIRQSPVVGTAIRLQDKWARFENLIADYLDGDDSVIYLSENIHDTLMDLSVYAKLLRILIEEENGIHE